MRRHGPVIAHCTDSEDFPTGVQWGPIEYPEAVTLTLILRTAVNKSPVYKTLAMKLSPKVRHHVFFVQTRSKSAVYTSVVNIVAVVVVD